ncbi:hypothetical protein [Oceanidesulfovibrio marinus]|uniref:DUF1980 domain-containing protein n=1 Tax=Oceanidesulfovibrio marinus TaxID=370038 RepID=A0A6P1ZMR8_9BACT|nr:hypothetical protein [Oceanidesulfovibrio marinus]TVM36810.1 hypothetical protein DQK91_02500 [Oceanidesulfovibrio marinus]
MASLVRLLEACLLALAGAFMLVLATSPMYWHFFNPKYSWLTFTAGAIVALLSLAGLLHRTRTPKASEIASLAVFLVLAGLAVTLPNPLFDVPPSGITSSDSFEPFSQPPGDAQAMADAENPPDTFGLDGAFPADPGAGIPAPTFDVTEEENGSRFTMDGVEYIKTNIAELILAEQENRLEPGGAYSVQGLVARTPELDEAGYIAVTRLFIVCCFADATGVAYLVDVDDPQSYTQGQWVHAAGTLAPAKTLPKTLPIAIPGAFTAIHGDKFAISAARVEPGPVPGMPFLFELRGKEPYIY